ncbi:hypothetical protein TRFO_23382 [Tritrichomonas foetus]|uniref:Condensation domain-containing protein n=1 Tax=Tritrichomonas foetus TaxID=1144522 RepID=A0A1J4KB91_9EUKA|nr:hypothetical protein TRFO_23382 [Tritrichomonas foetus]|eukprot:OHT08176.1 hypothetical protein TRFO_23382 [Tritrichomonas foetus]
MQPYILKRKKSPFEDIGFSDTVTHIQLAVKIDEPKIVPELVNQIKRNFLPLNIYETKEELIYKKGCSPILQLPNNIKDCKSACDWIYENRQLESVGMATLAHNNEYIALTANHMIGDGGLLKSVIDLLQNQTQLKYSSPLPIAPDEAMYEDLVNLDKNVLSVYPEQLTNVVSKFKPSEKIGEECRYALDQIDVNKLTEGNLTDKLWTALLLSMAAYNGKINRWGIATCIDMRPRTNLALTWSNCCFFSILSHTAPVLQNQTVGDVANALRKDMQRRLNNNEMSSFLRISESYYENEGLSAEISNVGSVELRKPLTDAWMQIRFNEKNNPSVLSLLTFGIKDQTRNDLILRLRYPPCRMKDEEADVILKGIKHSVYNIPQNTKVQDALDELKKFEAQYAKSKNYNIKFD